MSIHTWTAVVVIALSINSVLTQMTIKRLRLTLLDLTAYVVELDPRRDN